MTEHSFSDFLRRSLAVMRAECDLAYARIALQLEGMEVAITVDGQEVSVLSQRGELMLRDSVRPAVRARTTTGVLSRLLEADRTLFEAVWHEEVWLRGSLDDLLAFHDALETYFNGAVRCPSFPRLLTEFLGSQAERSRAASPPSTDSFFLPHKVHFHDGL